ncbi:MULTISPECIES: hypothetical protein [unclassified Streptomyces]|uniref:hypothetical protein n=1 Tax=unclassified Streptomyces TaxID=2593676 RepID=UPI00036351E3|nr:MULTISPECIES: hypothetical protein [unclassified Streptomyces]MYX36736.1 hypothetical protein [Streptomyces sp. SID8377]
MSANRKKLIALSIVVLVGLCAGLGTWLAFLSTGTSGSDSAKLGGTVLLGVVATGIAAVALFGFKDDSLTPQQQGVIAGDGRVIR